MNNTKELFLSTACKLFAQKGYHATGIAEILKISGAPKGSLYYHFPGGKEELAAEALRNTANNILKELAQELKTISDPMEAIAYHLRQLAQRLEQEEFHDKLSITLMALENRNCPNLLSICQKFYQGLEDLYKMKFMSQGRCITEAKALAVMVVALVEGSITLALTKENPAILANMADNLGQYLKY